MRKSLHWKYTVVYLAIPMNATIREPMTNPKPIKFYRRQWSAFTYISERNHDAGMFKLARIGADMLIKLTEQNQGALPLMEQVQLRRALVRRARRDKKRK